MALFTTQKDFIEYEKNESFEINAYGRLVASINNNHDLRRYGQKKDLQCKSCLADLGFLVYTRSVECSASQPRKKRYVKPLPTLDNNDDGFDLVQQ